ncbi:MAG: mechanosensitive ion channel [Candidatus Aenigmatarchaeota archaeon]|nr:MAG: mechanosensitive ion channel [Candidatus Aenigmarchaeota archaeon]
MDINAALQPAMTWINGMSARIIPEYIIPNLTIILQVILILAVAYIVGKVGKVLTRRLLNIVGLSRLTEKSWAESVLRITGYRGSIVELIADLVKWLIYILFFTFILQTVGLSGVTDIFNQVATFVPRFIGAILLIAVGFIIADFFGKVFQEASGKMLGGEGLGKFIGGLVRYTIGMVVLIMSLALLGVDTAALAILLSSLLVMVIVITTFGIKDVIPEITAGLHVRSNFRPGDRVKVAGRTGVIEETGQLVTKLKNGKSVFIVPNSKFSREAVEKTGKG